MNAEIVAVGTELLLGQIANTNAQVISRSLASIDDPNDRDGSVSREPPREIVCSVRVQIERDVHV